MKIEKIPNAVRNANTLLTPHRTARRRMVTQYTGANWSASSSTHARPINLMEMAATTYLRHVAPSRPKVLIEPLHSRETLRPVCSTLESAVDHVLGEIRLDRTVERWVLEALFSLSVVKVGLENAGYVELLGTEHEIGTPFVDNVDLDDFVLDMTAHRWDQLQFVGDCWTIPFDLAMDMGIFRGQWRRVAEGASGVPAENTVDGTRRTSTLGGSHRAGPLSNEMKIVRCWTVFLPFENRVVKYIANETGEIVGDGPWSDDDWNGPDEGPYHALMFGTVPGNIMPLPPMANLADMDEFINRTARKIMRQTDRSKTISVYRAGAEDDATRIRDAEDGEMVRSDDPASTREAKFGGADPLAVAWMVQLRSLFSYLGGNLDSLGGLSATADTATQEKLISEGSSLRVVDMQRRASEAVRGVVRQVAWYIWNDPVLDYPGSKSLPGTGISIPVALTKEDRESMDWLDMNVDLVPYSMHDRSPSERMAMMRGLFAEMVQAYPIMASQGMAPDFAEYYAKMAKLSNMPELVDLVMASAVPGQEQGMPQDGAAQQKPNQTTREYVRRNVPGASREGQDQVLTSELLGSKRQPSEMASAGRAVG